jgi:DNA-binding NarL/FixJ family response regulator
MRTSVLIVDDHGSFRAWARTLLERAGYAVVGEAANGASAIRAARDSSPEVVLLDIQLPDIDGFRVARRLCSWPTSPSVVLTSTRDALDYGERIQESCALGFLPKSEVSAEALGRLLWTGGGRDPTCERRSSD